MILKNAFLKTCLNQAFELEVANAHKAGYIKIPIYLSLGQEHIPAILSEFLNGWAVFPQHRSHSYLLSFGTDPEAIARELLGLPRSLNNGMGGSPSLSNKEKNIFGHSGLLGDQAPIAAGYSLASQQKTLCVLGDAACEEDYVLATLGFCVTKKCPILFVCEDNNLSILTEKHVRRSWDIATIARAFGLYSLEMIDSYNLISQYVENIELYLPAFINISTVRKLWHAGSGVDGPPVRDSFALFEQLAQSTYGPEIIEHKQKIFHDMNELWNQLRKEYDDLHTII